MTRFVKQKFKRKLIITLEINLIIIIKYIPLFVSRLRSKNGKFKILIKKTQISNTNLY